MIDGLSDAISNAGQVVGAMSNSGEEVEGSGKSQDGGILGGLTSLFSEDLFEGGVLGELAGSLLEGGGLDILSGGGMGSLVSGALDTLGFPEWAGNIAGAVVDFKTGNPMGAVQHGLAAAGGLAAEAGQDELAGFLDVAGDIQGMMTGGGGDIVASVTSGDMGNVLGGALPGLDMAGFVDASALGGQAESMSTQVETAQSAVDGDGSEFGTTVLGMLQGGVGDLTQVAQEAIEPGIGSALASVIGEGAGILGGIMDAFGFGGDASGLAEMEPQEILEKAGVPGAENDDVALSVAEFACELSGLQGQGDVGLGSAIMGSEAGQNMLTTMGEAAAEQVDGSVDDVGAMVMSLIGETAQTVAGMLDMASASGAVAGDVADILAQLGTMSTAAQVSEMTETHVRC